MARYSDNAPIGHTCPLINKVIDFLNSIDSNDVSESEIEATIAVLEEIRSANDTLRTWGNEMYKEREGFESDIDDLNRTVTGLKDDLENLEEK